MFEISSYNIIFQANRTEGVKSEAYPKTQLSNTQNPPTKKNYFVYYMAFEGFQRLYLKIFCRRISESYLDKLACFKNIILDRLSGH